MFHRIGDIARQHACPRADPSDREEILSIKDVSVETIVQPHIRIASAAFDPLGVLEHLGEATQIRSNLRMVGKDMATMRSVKRKTMAEYILKHRRHDSLIPHQVAMNKAPVPLARHGVGKEAVKLGALDYLPKPFEREQILNAVRGVLMKTSHPIRRRSEAPGDLSAPAG